jgi:hypothetical protein
MPPDLGRIGEIGTETIRCGGTARSPMNTTTMAAFMSAPISSPRGTPACSADTTGPKFQSKSRAVAAMIVGTACFCTALADTLP